MTLLVVEDEERVASCWTKAPLAAVQFEGLLARVRANLRSRTTGRPAC